MKKFYTISILAFIMAFSLHLHEVNAGVTSEAVSRAVEIITGKFRKEVAEIGTEKLTRQLTQIGGKYGDDVLTAAEKVGPKALRAIEEAGEHGATASKYIAKYGDDGLRIAKAPKQLALVASYGDDAATALIRHKSVGEIVITKAGKEGAEVLSKLTEKQSGRRLAALCEKTSLLEGEQGKKLLGVIGEYGDKALKYIWEHKGSLAVTAGLTMFLAKPELYINSGKDVLKDVGKEVVKDGTDAVVKTVPHILNSKITYIFMIFFFVTITIFLFLRHREKTQLARMVNNIMVNKGSNN